MLFIKSICLKFSSKCLEIIIDNIDEWLLWVKYSNRHFANSISLDLYVTLRNMYITHMLLMRNLGLREVVWVLQGHTAIIHTI